MAFKVSLVTWIVAFFVFALPLGSNELPSFLGRSPDVFVVVICLCHESEPPTQ